MSPTTFSNEPLAINSLPKVAFPFFTVPAPVGGIQYTYQTDQPSTDKHKDTQPPRMLNDRRWGTAFTQSVQYDKDVTISIDLGKKQDIRKLHVMFYQGPQSYEVESMTFHASDDGKQWTPLAVLGNDNLDKGAFVYSAIELSRDVSQAKPAVPPMVRMRIRIITIRARWP